MLKAGNFWIRFCMLITWNADQKLFSVSKKTHWQLSVQVFVSARAVPQQEPLSAWNHLNTFKSWFKMHCFPHPTKSPVVFLGNNMCFSQNLGLHSLTLENLIKFTHFTIDCLCLFCWSFFMIALNTAYCHQFWSLMINGVIWYHQVQHDQDYF